MKKKGFLSLIALMLAFLLAGCDAVGLREYAQRIAGQLMGGVVRFSDMEYTRPDLDEITAILEESCEAAKTGASLDAVLDGVMAYYEAYDTFYTRLHLADIYYCKDLTDLYWKEEYEFCSTSSAEVEQGLDTLYYALAASPLRGELEGEDYFGSGFFDAYDGETIWTDTYTALVQRESELVASYYDLCGQADEDYYSEAYFSAWLEPMGEILAQLVRVRKQIAQELGYEDYVNLAYSQYYARSFSPEEAADYLHQIGAMLTPLYEKANQTEPVRNRYFSEREVLQYVTSCASAMGGEIGRAGQLLSRAGLYDISWGENKFNGSFEVYLTAYQEPFILLNPSGTCDDLLAFAHEFGHFAADYAAGGSYAGTDVSEVLSQGMEYLSLSYAKAEPQVRQQLTQIRLRDCLYTYVEQAAYADFEQQLYRLSDSELTAAGIQKLYTEVLSAYGFDSWAWDTRDYICLSHFYTNPMYLFSYVISNDLALQIYQLEQEETGAGLALYTEILPTEHEDLLFFAEEVGLENPLEPGRLEKVAQTLSAQV